MHFTKMHGIGNDYVYVDCTKAPLADAEAVAIAVSDRHTGIGSDGLILICPSDVADFKMDMYNADGSRGKMCGNGIRCVGKYVYDHRLTDKTNLVIETGAGLRYLALTVTDGRVTEVRVDMGPAIFTPAEIPVDTEVLAGILAQAGCACEEMENENNCPSDAASTLKPVEAPIELFGRTWLLHPVSMGNPHSVIFCEEDVNAMNLAEIGPSFENHPLFPERVNTEFVNVLSDGSLRMRVWERGSGETMACGTGACAVAAAAIACGHAKSPVTVHLLGGDLRIEWNEADNRVYMTGPAAEVFEGDYAVK